MCRKSVHINWYGLQHIKNDLKGYVLEFVHIGKEFNMEMCYTGALVMPKQFTTISEEEMTYIDGGIGWGEAFELVAALLGANLAIIEIGERCGTYAYNHGYARDGIAKQVFDTVVYSNPFTLSTAWLFNIGYDNGWVAASKA